MTSFLWELLASRGLPRREGHHSVEQRQLSMAFMADKAMSVYLEQTVDVCISIFLRIEDVYV